MLQHMERADRDQLFAILGIDDSLALELAHLEPESAARWFLRKGHETAIGEGRVDVTRVSSPPTFMEQLRSFTPRVFITPLLIGLNVAVYLAMTGLGVDFFSPSSRDLIRWGANYGPFTTGGQWWRLFTSTFLHIGIIHLALNMWVLYVIGQLMERLVGNFGFLVLYLASGVLGSLASTLWHPYVVSAGASGSIFGLYGAFLEFVLKEKETIPPHVLAPLRSSAFSFIGYNLLFGLTGWVDMAAHLGGLAAGFACGLILCRPLLLPAQARRVLRGLMVALLAAGLVLAGVRMAGLFRTPRLLG